MHQKDLSKFRVISDENIVKRLFYSEKHEGEKGKVSISLVPIPRGVIRLENLLLTKLQDQSYYAKLEQLLLIDRSTQVDLTKYAAESSAQDVELTATLESINRLELQPDDKLYDEEIKLDQLPKQVTPEESLNDHTNVTLANEFKINGKIDSPNSINFTGANSYIINLLIKGVIAKLPSETFLSVNIYTVSETFLTKIQDGLESFSLIINDKSYEINSRESAEQLTHNLVADYRDKKPSMQIVFDESIDLSVFDEFDLITTIATSGELQTLMNFNFNNQYYYLLIVPNAYPKRYSYNIDQDFTEIRKEVENSGGENTNLQEIINLFNTTQEQAKNELNEIIKGIRNSINNDLPLTDTMKIANIQGVLNFNLKEIEYES